MFNMKKYTCITSMTKKMYDHIGVIMLDSWYNYFPRPHEMIVFSEEFVLPNNDRIQFTEWEKYCLEDWKVFASKYADQSSQRFAKKGFSFLHAMNNVQTDYLVWIDADILFHKNFSQVQLESILPTGKLVGFFDCFYQEIANYTQEQYLDINSRKQMAAESGFVIIDTKHKNFEEYKTRYKKLYTEDTKPAECRYWYDGEIVVESARYFLDQVFDLSTLRKTNKSQTPLNRSWLAEYFTHQKGRAKEGYTINQLKGFTNLK